MPIDPIRLADTRRRARDRSFDAGLRAPFARAFIFDRDDDDDDRDDDDARRDNGARSTATSTSCAPWTREPPRARVERDGR